MSDSHCWLYARIIADLSVEYLHVDSRCDLGFLRAWCPGSEGEQPGGSHTAFSDLTLKVMELTSAASNLI